MPTGWRGAAARCSLPTGYGTLFLAEGKETREINGHQYVLEYPIHADFALIKASGRPLGDLVYRKTARNFGPVIAAAAAQTTIAQVKKSWPWAI